MQIKRCLKWPISLEILKPIYTEKPIAVLTNSNFLSKILDFLKILILKEKQFHGQITICATKVATYSGYTFSFSVAYRAIVYILLKNNVNVKKMTKPIGYNYQSGTTDLSFYIDPSKNVKDTLEIEKNINVMFINNFESRGKDESQMEILKIIIFSDIYSVVELDKKIKHWISIYKDETEKYIDDGKKYFFSLQDKSVQEISPPDTDKQKNNQTVKETTESNQWKKNILITHKTFNNTFFTDKPLLLKKLNYFFNNEQLYKDRGIPYNLGILMHGEPGCGKTSCIKAISNITNRHIVEVNLKKIKTCSDFEKIFNENTMNGDYIPHDKKIIVLEDIDCMIDIVKSRNNSDSDSQISDKCKMLDSIDNDVMKFMMLQDSLSHEKWEPSDKLSLSCILNTIDGVLENYGRILIITTNYVDKLDSALVRPGRIDVKLHFTKCTNEMIHDIINNFYKDSTLDEKTLFQDNKYTPAEILELCGLHYDDMDVVINKLTKSL